MVNVIYEQKSNGKGEEDNENISKEVDFKQQK